MTLVETMGSVVFTWGPFEVALGVLIWSPNSMNKRRIGDNFSSASLLFLLHIFSPCLKQNLCNKQSGWPLRWAVSTKNTTSSGRKGWWLSDTVDRDPGQFQRNTTFNLQLKWTNRFPKNLILKSEINYLSTLWGLRVSDINLFHLEAFIISIV